MRPVVELRNDLKNGAAAGAIARVTDRPNAMQTHWRVMVLLVFSAGINYIDRGSLSVAAPVLGKAFFLSPTQMGLLFSAFFWSYAGFMVVAGWLADRYPTGLVLGAGFFVWSLATLGTGLASTLQMLLLLRCLLGLGESVAYPVCSRIIAESFPIQQRGLPNAMIDAGVKVGPALGILIGGLLLARFGWRAMFIVLGLGGMVWLLPWFLWAPRSERGGGKTEDSGPSILEICRRRDAWGTFVGNFCCNYAYYFLLSWLPSYFVTERHVSISKMAILASLPFWGSAATSLFAGWISDRWMSAGAPPTLVRKTFVVGGFVFATFMFPAALVSDLRISVAFLVVAYLGFGLIPSNHWAITQTLAGPLAAGKWTGLQNGIANLAGIVAPLVTGLIVSKTGSFYLAFLSSSIILLVGALCYWLVVGRIAPIHWSSQPSELVTSR
jgi:MFS transporter, ACS family, D-galactonate transporter